MGMDREPEAVEYALLTSIWAKVQSGPEELRLTVYGLIGPDLERWAIIGDGDVPDEVRRPILDHLYSEARRSVKSE